MISYVDSMHQVPGPRWLEEHRRAAKITIRADNTEVAAQAIASGAGIGVVPCFAGDARTELQRLFHGPVATATGWLVYHEASRDSARVRAAVDVLAQLFESHATIFSGVPEPARGRAGP